ncbi:metal tolerance protein C2-like isoform X1 [Dendrobium catenatum]|uniref:metal tolerance protein C2-like isoform X1 n=1 Tax=Dendrobium catenatum TaxID=906689 RepID=UPI0009F4065E|nr:metal tolerance protein C2-like isoform X1 [Dendrobium catenatum]
MADFAVSSEPNGGTGSSFTAAPATQDSFKHRLPDGETQRPWSGRYGIDSGDRRFSFSRNQSFKPQLLRNDSCIGINHSEEEELWEGHGKTEFGGTGNSVRNRSVLYQMASVLLAVRSGNRQVRRLALLISLNVAYSTVELMIGLLTGRVGLVSDSFHLTFGCGLLTFSLFAMTAAQKKPDGIYTYGYKRLEVLAAFTNALFLLFMSFSLAVEALHAFIQDESEHKHYLIVSAVTNLLVNLLGVWFFRNYARVNIAYRKAEDMNCHSICLHVLADSIRRRQSSFLSLICEFCLSAGLVLASWLLSLGVENAEVLCLGLVSAAVFVVILPLFRATGGVLLQQVPANVPTSAFNKCLRQVTALEEVSEVTRSRFWELVPGRAVGSLSILVKGGENGHSVLHYVHELYHDLGIQDLTVQTDHV